MKLLITPLARKELKEAVDYYKKQAGLATALALLAEFDTASNLLQGSNESDSVFRGKRNRYVLHKFPYSIIYQIKNDEVQIIAFAHHKRRPEYWMKRKVD